MKKRNQKRGSSPIQFALILATVGIAVVVGSWGLGKASNSQLNQAASDVADPAQLTSRFGNSNNSAGPTNSPTDGDCVDYSDSFAN